MSASVGDAKQAGDAPRVEHRIKPPRDDRPPMIANVFDVMRRGNSQLLPLFPYLHPGAMVPAGAIFRGGPGKSYGQFFHHNTVDEVALALATNGGLLKTGQVFVGGRVHGVTSFLKNDGDPESFGIYCITQRQSDTDKQTEAYELRCAKCHERILYEAFDASPPADAHESTHPFATLAVAPDLLKDYNESAQRRTCPKCGHVNDPFPLAAWGWDAYTEQAKSALDGRAALSRATPTNT